MAAVAKVQNGAAREAQILLLVGSPGTGKSRCVDNYGASTEAIYIEGMPEMTLSYTREFIAYQLGVKGLRGFKQSVAIDELMLKRRKTIILDEAQHGLDKKATVIEYLRRLCEKAGVMLILVCHDSERYRFAEDRLAHIATRISALAEFEPATLDDTALYLKELCEVAVDDGVIKQAFQESRGRYRLLTSVCRTLEVMAKQLNKTHLTMDDVKDICLCEDVTGYLRKRKGR